MDANQQELKVDNDELNYDTQSDGQSSFDLEGMDPEQRQKLEEELKLELAKVRVISMEKLMHMIN